MQIRILDGVAQFATHLIKGDFSQIEHDDMRQHRLSLNREGIPIWPNCSLSEAETFLKGLGIPYEVETLDYEVYKVKAQGIIYGDRTEVIEHILNDKEPKSQVIPNLKKKLEKETKRNDDLEARLLKLEKA